MILQPDCMRLLIRDVKLKTHSNERPNFPRMIESQKLVHANTVSDACTSTQAARGGENSSNVLKLK